MFNPVEYLKNKFSVQKNKNEDEIIKLVGESIEQMNRPRSNIFGRDYEEVCPPYPFGYSTFDTLKQNSTPLRVMFQNIRREVFRNGYDVIEAENSDSDITDSQQENSADKKKKKIILDFCENANENGQTVIDVFKELEDDMNLYDDAWLYYRFLYQYNNDGEIIDYKLNEILRIDPTTMRFVINKFDIPGEDDAGNKIGVCPLHRNFEQKNNKCSICGKKTYKAFYVQDVGGDKMYFTSNEILHTSKFFPSRTFGCSPMYALWCKVRSEIYMDNYIMELFEGKRPPKGGLFFKTSNAEGLKKMWNDMIERARENPNLPMVMGVPDGSNGQGFVEFIDFMKSNAEVQYSELRAEIWARIGAMYGVEPVFHADLSTSGGLNNEGLQITVTNRAVEGDQYIFNTKYFPKIINALQADGWVLRLKPSEEEDKVARIDRTRKSLENASLAVSVGLEAEYDQDTGEAQIKSGTLSTPKPDPEENFYGIPPKDDPLDFSFDEEIEKSNRPQFSTMSNIIKEKVDKIIEEYGKNPNSFKLGIMINAIKSDLLQELKNSADSFISRTYQKEMQKAEKELSMNFSIDEEDESSINYLQESDVLYKAYKGLTDKMTEKVNEIIVNSMKGGEAISPDKIKKRISKVAEIADNRAERIARTETGKIMNAARINSYQKADPENEFKYRHIGPDDNRTSKMSKEIKQKTQKGVKWDEYLKIMQEVVSKYNPKWKIDPRAPISHPNTRHTFVRVV